MSALLDAACFYRAQNLASIPNEGTRTEPLVNGSRPPVFVADAVIGNYMHYPTVGQPVGGVGFDSSMLAAVPSSALNGAVTFGLRYRPEHRHYERLLMSVVDNPGSSQLKHFMLTLSSGNKYLARVWATNANHSQMACYGTILTAEDRTDDIFVTWDETTKTLALTVNGVTEATAIAPTGYTRSSAVSSPLQVPQPDTTLPSAGKYFRVAYWNRPLSTSEMAGVVADTLWTADGAAPPPPPPPPPPPALVVKFNGTQVAWTVALNGNAVGVPGDTIDIFG